MHSREPDAAGLPPVPCLWIVISSNVKENNATVLIRYNFVFSVNTVQSQITRPTDLEQRCVWICATCCCRECATRTATVEGVKAARRKDPIVPSDILERNIERFSTTSDASRAAHGCRVTLLSTPTTFRPLVLSYLNDFIVNIFNATLLLFLLLFYSERRIQMNNQIRFGMSFVSASIGKRHAVVR